MNFLIKAWSFLRRDFLTAISYKFAFFIQFGGIFFSTLTFFFLSRLLGKGTTPYLAPYGGDYFSFVLIGIAFSGYLGVSLSSFAGSIRQSQVLGTLEALLVTQTDIPTIIVGSSLYNFILTSFHVVVYLLMGIFIFGAKIGGGNLGAALVILILTIVSFSSLGIISACFILVFKRGDPFTWIFTSLSGLLGGVIYPVAILPPWLQKISTFLPLTHALEGMRMALLRNYSLKALLPQIVFLVAFSLVMFPLSIFLFRLALRKAKVDGTLTQY